MKERVLKTIGLLMFVMVLGSVFVVPAYSLRRVDTGDCYQCSEHICIVGEHEHIGYALTEKDS